MSTGFPQFSHTAKLGELGVNIVSRIVSDTFGWLFKRNHQEHDFGIDGQIELVTDDGAVTGQMLAIQIKCGRSFLTEKNKWGYVFRGEMKHFNYLVNYPIPVLVCLCDPDSSDCYWVHFRPELTQATETGWKMTVPLENKLAASKAALQALVNPIRDGIAELQAYWELNKIISESSSILYVLDEHDVKNLEVAMPRAFFDRLRCSKELAHECQGKVEISFSGYDEDPRELFEIEEVRAYVAVLDRALPELFFFVRTERPTYTLMTFALCQTEVEWVDGRSTKAVTKEVRFDTRNVAGFLERHWPGLNELTDWLGMSIEENKRISFAVIRCLGFEPPERDDVA